MNPAQMVAEIERLKAHVRRLEEMIMSRTDDKSTYRSINDPIDDDGSVVFVSHFFESGKKASASANRLDLMRMSVGKAQGQDRLGNSGIINMVYGPNNGMINAGYDHLTPPAS